MYTDFSRAASGLEKKQSHKMSTDLLEITHIRDENVRN